MSKILIVEDEGIVGLDIQKRLDRMGHQVCGVVSSGAEAIREVEKHAPDLVLMDIMIEGGMDGVETAERLRQRFGTPIVFLTAYSDNATLQRAKITQPFGYILKPFKDRELHSTIEIVLHRRQLEKNLQEAHDELERRVQERTRELARVNEELKREIEERQRAAQEKALLQEQLRQTQKMEALGQLAGGVAHDFNNMLTIITGYSELVLNCMGEDDPLYRDVRAIKEAGHRAAALTGQLLTFGRRHVMQYRTLDLNRAVEKAGDMLQRMIGEDIHLELRLQEGLYYVRTDPGQFDQLLLNLAVNARDAMPRGGRLTLSTHNLELDKPCTSRFVNLEPGSYACLRVADTGTGIGEEILGRIFEPFFTTKEKGRGTGLGLSMAYSIVTQSGGQIDVSSQPGEGTVFAIYLPKAEGVPEPEVERLYGPEERLLGNEIILLVEDEDVVRDLARRILHDHGYDVLEARQGEEALALAELHGGPIHLLLTDVVMPKMSGRQLAEHLGPRWPDMKVLYMSGYTDDAILRYGVREEEVSFLQKPFSSEGLVAKVRQVLGNS
jgi:signal transduction histidine kinase